MTADVSGTAPAFARDGAERHPGAAASILSKLHEMLGDTGQAGQRIGALPDLAKALAPTGPIGAVAALSLGAAARPVRALLFDKSAAANWSLAWHQDRVIAVRTRRDVPGFGPWTMKQGLLHVAPPFAILAGMVTLRVHLDDVAADNAPLLIARGSHRFGRVPEPDMAAAVAGCETWTCLAQAGDIWRYATPILHASAAAERPGRRRVLQLDYAAAPLPGGLDWAGL